MLKFIGEYIELPVFGLQEGSQISYVTDAIIDPRSLKIVGFYCDHRATASERVLLTEDIREINNEGVIIDSDENLVDPSELVRLEDILDMSYRLIDNDIRSESGTKQGTVTDYVIDDESYRIERIYGKPRITHAISNDYVISRSQIVSVTHGEVTVKDARDGSGKKQTAKKDQRERKGLFGFSI